MKLRTIMSSFNGGELSRRLEGRVDADGIYDRGLKTMFNFVPTVEGPAVKRPGTRFVKAAAATSAWLSRFVFNVTQSYVLEWLEGKVRFFTNGGRIESPPGTAYEVNVPYTAAHAPRLSIAPSKDVMRIAHGAYPVGKLTRTGASTFAYAAAALRNGPFKDQNIDRVVTVSASGVTGGVTLTASAAIFQAGHVGAAFLLEAADFADVEAWQVGLDGITVGMKRRSDGKVYQAATAGRTGTIQPVHTDGSEWDGDSVGKDINAKGPYGVRWTYLHDRFGIATITAIGGGGTTATATVTRRLASSLTATPSFRWAHCAFSAAEGWPSLVAKAWGRMVYFKELEMFGSVVGDYDNFAYFTDSGLFAPDMAFRRTLDSADAPLWVKATGKHLLVGTASGELLIGALNSSLAISGDNIGADPQSSYGSAEVWPAEVGSAILFAQRGARKLREAEYQFDRDRFVGVNITAWARHIGRSGFRQLAFQQEPEEMLWGVRADGLLAAHAHSPEQQVKGFSRVALADGAAAVRSAVAIPSQDGARDELWLLAEQGGAKSILRLADWWEEDDGLDEAGKLAQLKGAFFVDLGVSYDGAPRTSFPAPGFAGALDHLAGRACVALADGGVVRPVNVPAGTNVTVTLPYAASKVAIGLPYTARLAPMRPEARGNATVQGLRKRIVRMVARLIDTAALLVTSKHGRDRLIDRPGSAAMDQPVPLFNGDTANVAIGGGYDREGQPEIVSDDPLPCIIPALMLQLEAEQ